MTFTETDAGEQAAAESIRRVANKEKHEGRLLVADDCSVVRLGVVSWIHSQSTYSVVAETDNAKKAVQLSLLLKPNIILMDVTLGSESGVRVASEIRRLCGGTEIIAFTASADSMHLRGMLAAGAKGYVLKTSTLPVLLSAIRAVLRGSTFLDPGLSRQLIEELGLFPASRDRAKNLLTKRESQVLERIVWGYTDSQVAFDLSITRTTVNTYRMRLCEKLGLRGRAEIVRYGVAIGLTRFGVLPLDPLHKSPGPRL